MRRLGYTTTGTGIMTRSWGGTSRRIRLGWMGGLIFTPIPELTLYFGLILMDFIAVQINLGQHMYRVKILV
jgi:hypothetical protein